MACECIRELSREEKERYLRRYITETHIINDQTQQIWIYSKIKHVTKICLNAVSFNVSFGPNKICLCKLANSYSKNLKLAANYLCKLEKRQINQFGVEIFVLKSYDHHVTCPSNSIPTLSQLCYFELLIKGVTGHKLKALADKGIIPTCIYTDRPTIRYHLGYFSFTEWFSICCPSGSSRLVSCKEPIKHLGINPLEIL
jgi:hypothetical protein